MERRTRIDDASKLSALSRVGLLRKTIDLQSSASEVEESDLEDEGTRGFSQYQQSSTEDLITGVSRILAVERQRRGHKSRS